MNFWLRKAKTEIDSLDAELILLQVLGFRDRSELVLYSERELDPREIDLANGMLEQRKKHVPLAYILGGKEFYGREFLVTPDTLIPRAETEDCVRMVLFRTASDESVATDSSALGLALPGSARPSKGHPNTILDIGTGSGCIAITLALEISGVEVVGIDISEGALRVAKENARRLSAENVEFLQSDLLKDYQGERPDVIVANLPYVDREWAWVSPEIEFEPEGALFAEKHGLALIVRLLDEIKQKWYNKEYDYPLYLYLEADPCQHQKIIEYAKSLGFEYLRIENFIIELRI